MNEFEIKGWCPGALRPMMSGDGLVVRVRPRAGRLSMAQALGIAQAARDYGSGSIDLSSRANLQLRGVDPDRHADLLLVLDRLGLLDADPVAEARRNIVVTPFWSEPGLEPWIAAALETALASYALPLPGKFGFAVDCGSERVLHSVPADIRIERSADGKLIVRPDGSAYGLHIEPSEAATAAMALAHWFIQSGGVKHGRGRMAAHIASGVALPASLCGSALPVEAAPVAFPGLVRGGALAGLAFGSMHAGTLDQIARHGQELRLTPWRMIFLPSVSTMPVLQDVIVDGRDPLLRVQACTGSPSCPQGRAETRRLARKLARHLPDAASLHVSGCPKGCACARPATVTLVATPDGFDYIRNGTAADKAMLTGISAADLEKHSAYYLAGHA